MGLRTDVLDIIVSCDVLVVSTHATPNCKIQTMNCNGQQSLRSR